MLRHVASRAISRKRPGLVREQDTRVPGGVAKGPLKMRVQKQRRGAKQIFCTHHFAIVFVFSHMERSGTPLERSIFLSFDTLERPGTLSERSGTLRLPHEIAISADLIIIL